jgi:septal ring factor EnvC (AmiA/AmiB activator)
VRIESRLIFLERAVLEPSFTLCRENTTKITDLSADVKERQGRVEDLQKEVLELSQKRTILALDEQKLNTARSNALQDLATARRTCDGLFLAKEKLEREVPQLEAEVE